MVHNTWIVMSAVAALTAGLAVAHADERRFTYTYEPETLPQGALEFENWVTLRSGRSAEAGREDFTRWDLRQEIEYGVTDRYTVGLYLNETTQSYRDSATEETVSDFDFKGVSLENRFNVLNPAISPVGLTLYLEGTYSGEEAELEQKIILGKRHGAWKWAVNLVHETEWEDFLEETEGKLLLSAGLARDLSPNWSLGLEWRVQTLWPEYDEFEATALHLGPVVSYHHERWWAALSVLPQLFGWNHDGADDGSSRLDLAHHERLYVRFLLGIHL